MENGCSDAVCGNGIVEEGEECDGSDPKNGIYCSDTCELEVIIEPQDPTDGGTIIKDDTTIK